MTAKPLAGRVALITGASTPRGIGRAIAHRLASDGAAVVLTDIERPEGEDGALARMSASVAEIEAHGGRALALALDVTEAAAIQTTVAEVSSRLGPIDILVNNAGSLAGVGPFLETDARDWDLSYRVNLLGPMLLSQAVIPGMKSSGGGTIVNIGSTGSLGAEAGFGAYTAMKHGLIGLTKTIAAEFGPDGIRCNAVCPGFIMTDMHAAANERLAAEAGRLIADIQAERYAEVALRQVGNPQDVAEAVAYLAGPAGAYITGIALPVAGGVSFGL
ncbi:MAG: SDR family NAD(P)-dependent oxidoreductase [Pseudomonadota bacterium]